MLDIKTENESEMRVEAWRGKQAPSSKGFVVAFKNAIACLHAPFQVLEREGNIIFSAATEMGEGTQDNADGRFAGYLPPLPLENLGDSSFTSDHGLRYAYIAGAMANGIASVELVEAMARAGMLGFFGAGGLELPAIETAINRLTQSLHHQSFGFNLIHSPNEPEHEAATVALYLRRGIRLVEAAAYLHLTLPLVRYRVTGIQRGPEGQILTPHRIIAKVSRVEVATPFFSPPPEEYLNELVRTREITTDQAQMASEIPVAQDITAEADSAGHTDNRPLVTLLPTFLTLRDRLQQKFKYSQALRVGAAGGLSTPSSLAAAFAMGAAYVVTGSINQACVESGASDVVRQLLAKAEQADTAMAPAADMFEMGVKVQVLKRGTMFPMRAAKLYELYRTYAGLDAIPPAERAVLEKQYFRCALEEAWQNTLLYFMKRDPSQVERAERDAKHKMALVFRGYLGLSSRWANSGEPSRVMDYQVWCGPAMGAFNEWARGTFLEKPENRRVASVALNLLYGAAVQLRVQALRMQGVPLPAGLTICPPMNWDELQKVIKSDE
jgi:PfaD family protein